MALAMAGMFGLMLPGCKPGGGDSSKPPGPPVSTNRPPSEDQSLWPDWPQWRHDAQHTANSPEDLPAVLHLQWTRQYAPRVQVWDDPLNHDLMPYDRVFEPVVLNNRLFIGFNDCDKVVALDTRTGKELWTFFTDGPVRLPPAAWQHKVYFVSDDGYLYCVSAVDGALVWKFRGGPSARKVLGNGRLVSAWPARGGPVVRDGQVYFAASIWPFMGTFIYALDARTGALVWVNDSTGAQYIKQPHSAPSFAGVAPQGTLVAGRDTLLVPGGRSVPAAFDRYTGRFLYFQIEDSGKGNGGSFVAASDTEFFVHTRRRGTRVYDLKTGKKSDFTLSEPVVATNQLFSAQESSLRKAVLDAEQKLIAAHQSEADAEEDLVKATEDNSKDGYKNATNALASAKRKISRAEADLTKAQAALGTNFAGGVVQAVGNDKAQRWQLPADGTGDLIKAGQRLYAAGTNGIMVIELLTNKLARVVATNAVEGSVQRLLAAGGMLFAVTLDGRIMTYGGEARTPEQLSAQRARAPLPPDALARAAAILDRPGVREGYGLCFGTADSLLLEALARQSRLHLVSVEPDPAKVEPMRRRLDAAGLYGTRVVVQAGDPVGFKAPPYLANLIVVGEASAGRLKEPGVLTALYESLRPYGGTLWISAARTDAASLASWVKSAGLDRAILAGGPEGVVVVRDGPLPDSGSWTHQYGDAGNSVKSDDRRVQLPLGLLWFGGPTHVDVLPRHGHGPSPQVIGGRLFVEGMDCLSARDVYTGRTLWKTSLPDLNTFGVYYDASYVDAPLTTAYTQKHIPGANGRGANFVATADALYVAVSNACRVLDARTGEILRTIELPPVENETEPRQWGYLGVEENVLLAGHGFALFSQRLGLSATNRTPSIVDLSASRGLVAFDRRTGQQLWRVEAQLGFLHNGIALGNGRVYVLDKQPRSVRDRIRRRGQTAPPGARLAVFHLGTGQLLWETKTDVFGTWLGYSSQHDVLVQAGATATDRLRDESDKGLAAYAGASGAVLWKKLDVGYNGPCILHHDTILTTPASYKANAGAFGLLDGVSRKVPNPLTGQPEAWRIYRTYGCNYPVACENVMTFRSGAAGFYDLQNRSGSGNLGGFKSGCSANLIPADGVLNAPDYTRTCACPYQNQTSLALVHWPELEMWTHNQFGRDAKDGERIRHLGINFGAPGDRLTEDGTLWMDYPNVSGTSPNLMVAVRGRQTNYFCHTYWQFQGEGPAWVMASGVRNARTILISPETRKAGPPPSPPKRPLGVDDPDYEDESSNTNGTKNATNTLDTSGSIRLGLDGHTESFNSNPPPRCWSTYSVPRSAPADGKIATCHLRMASIAAEDITGTLGTKAAAGPDANAYWNSGLQRVVTQPTGGECTLLMATLLNQAEGTVDSLAVSYTMADTVPGVKEAIKGHLVYYSLTGASDSWIYAGSNVMAKLPGTNTVSFTLTSLSWQPGANLYIVWMDDNGASNPDGDFSIDDITFTPTVPPFGVTLTSPSDGQSYAAPATIELAACANSGSGATIAGVGFYNTNGTWLATGLTSPYHGTCDVSSATTIAVVAIATNSLGGMVTSAPPALVMVTKDLGVDTNTTSARTNGAGGAKANSASKSKSGGAKTNKTETVYKSTLPEAAYTVRLYFAEPDEVRRGERVFDVLLQGKRVLRSFDVTAQAGGRRRGVVKQFSRVVVKGELEIRLTPVKSSLYGPVISGVEMILEEDANIASP
jgi:outer membrane protein assembly factor BamB